MTNALALLTEEFKRIVYRALPEKDVEYIVYRDFEVYTGRGGAELRGDLVTLSAEIDSFTGKEPNTFWSVRPTINRAHISHATYKGVVIEEPLLFLAQLRLKKGR